ncbi:MAG: hypothetical protein AAF682_22095 [Planctomycetota bacterium]
MRLRLVLGALALVVPPAFGHGTVPVTLADAGEDAVALGETQTFHFALAAAFGLVLDEVQVEADLAQYAVVSTLTKEAFASIAVTVTPTQQDLAGQVGVTRVVQMHVTYHAEGSVEPQQTTLFGFVPVVCAPVTVEFSDELELAPGLTDPFALTASAPGCPGADLTIQVVGGIVGVDVQSSAGNPAAATGTASSPLILGGAEQVLIVVRLGDAIATQLTYTPFGPCASYLGSNVSTGMAQLFVGEDEVVHAALAVPPRFTIEAVVAKGPLVQSFDAHLAGAFAFLELSVEAAPADVPSGALAASHEFVLDVVVGLPRQDACRERVQGSLVATCAPLLMSHPDGAALEVTPGAPTTLLFTAEMAGCAGTLQAFVSASPGLTGLSCSPQPGNPVVLNCSFTAPEDVEGEEITVTAFDVSSGLVVGSSQLFLTAREP